MGTERFPYSSAAHFTSIDRPAYDLLIHETKSIRSLAGHPQGRVRHHFHWSGALVAKPYSFRTRFEGEQGTNPEELIGAAHAGCFSMAFSMMLGMAGFTPDKIETTATITLEQKDGGFAVTASHLDVTASIPGIDEATFQDVAGKAKAGCPISKLLNATITMDARLA